jgi:hypothetical protein
VSERRRVRVTEQFFGRLDELLPAERTSSGEPSATDFLLHEMPPIIDKLATDFEGTTTPTPSRPTVRALIAAGLLVPYLAVYAELAADGSVEAFYLDIG